MKLFTETEIVYDGKKLRLVWDGHRLYVESEAKLAKVVSVNNWDDSANGNVGIEFDYDT